METKAEARTVRVEAPVGAQRCHELKTDPAVFQAVLDGEKTYELRKNDRGFAKGHELRLRETRYTGAEMAAGAPLEYTGREVLSVVTHMLTGPIYGLEAGWSILSMRPNANSATTGTPKP